jgi:trk system potassium uptake protein TrkH
MTYADRIASLSFSVRPVVIAHHIGQLCLVLAALSLVPIAVSLIFGETALTGHYGVVTLVLLVLGALSRLPSHNSIQTNEALVITTAMFVFMPLLNSYPMMSTAGMSFIDALFEGVSGVTTTGLSTLGSLEDKSHTFLFSRSWMQWYGGLGIVVLTIALLMGPSGISKRLSQLQIDSEDMVGSAKLIARKAMNIYLILTLLGFLLLWATGVEGFTALVHTLSAVSTGGFSNFDDSLAGLANWQSQGVITLFSLLGAIPLLLYYRCYGEGWYSLHSNVQVRMIILACLMVTTLLTLSMHYASGFNWHDALTMGPMLAISAQSTTGFSPVVIAELDAGSKLLLIASMLTGGGLGSTAGGIKILRLLILMRLLQLLIQRTSLPDHAVVEPRLGNERLKGPDIERALLIILLFQVVIFISWIPFVVIGYDPLNSLFEVVSATATVGLSTGITHAELDPLLKAVLCFNMLAGRVEIIALLVVLYPPTWLGKRKG